MVMGMNMFGLCHTPPRISFNGAVEWNGREVVRALCITMY